MITSLILGHALSLYSTQMIFTLVDPDLLIWISYLLYSFLSVWDLFSFSPTLLLTLMLPHATISMLSPPLHFPHVT